MLKSLCNSICKIKPRETLWIHQLKLCSTEVKHDIEDDSGNTELLKNETKILEVINGSGLTHLKRFIDIRHAKMIITCRNVNGAYESLNDLILRNEIESDVLKKFYNKVINFKPKSKRFYTTPKIKFMEEIPNTTLGIHVGPTVVSWALLTKRFELQDWDYAPWYNGNLPNNAYDLVKLVGHIISKLPTCDTYVVEDIYTRNLTPKCTLFWQHQLTVAIMACLKLLENQRTGGLPIAMNSIYMLQPQATARFHKLALRTEAMSTNYIMKKLINDNTEASDNEYSELSLNDTLKDKYLTENKYKQEEMSWSVLKGMMFVQLVRNDKSSK